MNDHFLFILIPGFDHSFDLIFVLTFHNFFFCVIVFLFLFVPDFYFVSTFTLIIIIILCMQTKWETIVNVLKGIKGKWEVTTHEKGGMHNPQKGVIITHKCDLVKTMKHFDREI